MSRAGDCHNDLSLQFSCRLGCMLWLLGVGEGTLPAGVVGCTDAGKASVIMLNGANMLPCKDACGVDSGEYSDGMMDEACGEDAWLAWPAGCDGICNSVTACDCAECGARVSRAGCIVACCGCELCIGGAACKAIADAC